VRRYAANADVLFLGSSRMQFAFSTIATDEWFASASASHYLLGFSHTENANFAAPLLARIKPQAKVYVVNVDSFFNDVETGPASQLLHDKEIETRYKEKALWQRVHRKLCGKLSSVCGKKFAYFRAQKTGHWVVRGVGRNDPAPVADDAPSDQDKWDKYGIFAKQFIASLPVDRSCVLLTVVPYPTTRRAEAEAIASAVGIELISPTVEDLRTFDGSHLDHESAQRWSKAFFDLAGPRIQRCLASTTKAAADQSSVLP
jgi:hypothetical protein